MSCGGEGVVDAAVMFQPKGMYNRRRFSDLDITLYIDAEKKGRNSRTVFVILGKDAKKKGKKKSGWVDIGWVAGSTCYPRSKHVTQSIPTQRRRHVSQPMTPCLS